MRRNLFIIFALLFLFPVLSKGEISADKLLQLCKRKPHPRLFKPEEVAKLPEDEAEKLWNKKKGLLGRNLLSPEWAKKEIYSKGGFLKELALLYRKTGRKEFADKVIEGFQTIGKGGFWKHMDRRTSWGLSGYAEALDLIYDYFKNTKKDIFKKVVDKIAKKADDIYQEGLKDIYEAKYYFLALGRVGVVLAEYRSPYSSGPKDWLRAGTEYLFKEHPKFHRPLDGMFNPGGLYSTGGYKGYFYNNLFSWVNQCENATGVNLIKEFPFLRRIMLNMCWEITPYGTAPEYTAMHRLSYSNWMAGVAPMLRSMIPPERYWVMWFIENLPDCRGLLWLRKEIKDWNPKPPPWTDFISEDAESIVFRESWQKKEISDYIFMRVEHYPFFSYRPMCHHDNLSFECWLHGDASIIDCGEVRGGSHGQGGGYGPITAKGHNVVMLDDGEGNIGGAVKGQIPSSAGHPRTAEWKPEIKLTFYNPAHILTSSVSEPIKFAVCGMKWEWMEKYEDFHFRKPGEGHFWWFFYEPFENFAKKMKNPVIWERTLIYPYKEYFVIVDNISPISNPVERRINTLFHLGSWRVDKGRNVVKGKLEIEGKKFAWEENPFRKEIEVVKRGNKVKWFTKNVRNQDVELTIYSVPESVISCEKYWSNVGRVEGIDHPLIRFKIKAPQMHRITVISSRFLNEPEKKFKSLNIKGGNAVKVESGNISEYIFAGPEGEKKIVKFSTDAKLGYIRIKNGKLSSLLLVGGSNFKVKGEKIIESESPVKHLTVEFLPLEYKGHFESKESTKIRFAIDSPVKNAYYVPDVDEWTRMIEGESKEKLSLKWKKNGKFVELIIPEGKGKFVIKLRDITPPSVKSMAPKELCPGGVKKIEISLLTDEEADCYLIKGMRKIKFESKDGKKHSLSVEVESGKRYTFNYLLKDKEGNTKKIKHSFRVANNKFWDEFETDWMVSKVENVIIENGVKLVNVPSIRLIPTKDAITSPFTSYRSGSSREISVGYFNRLRTLLEFKLPSSLSPSYKQAKLILKTIKTESAGSSMVYNVYVLKEDFSEESIKWKYEYFKEPVGKYKAEGDLKGKDVIIPLKLNLIPGKKVRLMIAPSSNNYRADHFYSRESLYPPVLKLLPPVPMEGIVISKLIEIGKNDRWNKFMCEVDTPSGTEVKISILGEGGETLLDNVKNGQDISTLEEKKIKLKATLISSKKGISPLLKKWEISWRKGG